MINTHCHSCSKPVSTKGSHLCGKCYYHQRRKEERECSSCQQTYFSPKETKSTVCTTCREIKFICTRCNKGEVYSMKQCLPCYRQKTINCHFCDDPFIGSNKTITMLCPACKRLKRNLMCLKAIYDDVIRDLDRIQDCDKCKQPFVMIYRAKGTVLCTTCSLTDRSLRWYNNNLDLAVAQGKQARLRKLEKDPNYERESHKKRLGHMTEEERTDHFRKRNEYRQANQMARNAVEGERRANKLNQTPSWSEEELIKEFYKSCPEGYHVDHIIPLNHSKVAGLHVLSNLQHLPSVLNLKKSNKLIPLYMEENYPSCIVDLEEHL